jgi:hypothetical protein
LKSNTITVKIEGLHRSGAVILHSLGRVLVRRKTGFSMYSDQNRNVIFNPLNHERMITNNQM